MEVKIALTTTFPNWVDYPKETIPTWLKHMPEDLTMLIGLDPCPNIGKTDEWLAPLCQDRIEKEKVLVSRDFKQEQIDFLQRNKEREKTKDYRMDYVRFSFKVFTLHEAMIYAENNGFDYLVWLDADVLLKKDVSYDDIDKWLPKDKVASYLGRKDWDHSECGFMIFNLKEGGAEFIKRLHQMYVTDEVLTLTQWHDSFVFDTIREEFNKANDKDVFLNLTQDVSGRDVFDDSILSEFMEHKKGVRKFQDPSSSTVDLNQLKVVTKNCVKDDIIQNNVKENSKLINNWLDICKPNDEEVVIASAGPSLCVEEIRPFYERGVKIVAVKHALQELLDNDIVPYACILLDPREHVKDFVKHPKAKDILWLVASMVSPEVVKILSDQGCKIWGYHAYVGAGEQEVIPEGHKMVAGGSATATRGIAVLDMLGFRKFHLFAYDLCSLEKPDLEKKKGDKPIWMEITLESETASENKIKRTFWTKGEFLAQVQEMKKFLQDAKTTEFHIYGEGIIPWIHKHIKLRNKWLKFKKEVVFKSVGNVEDLLSKYNPIAKDAPDKKRKKK